ncbi:MAG: oligosaccharide flippase family protein [Patescibacteria group bacterium]
MENDSPAYQALKNSSFSFVGYAFPIVFSIFVTPVLVYKLGVERYGLYVLINTILVLLGLLDLGLSTALIKYLAQYHAQQEENKIKNLFYSNNSLFFIIGVLGLAIMVALGYWGKAIFQNSSLDQNLFLITFSLAGITFFINTVNSVFTITPRALQRFDLSTKIDLTQLTILNLGALALALLGYKLIAILALQAGLALVFSFVYRRYAKKILPLAKLKLAWVKTEVKNCYQFGLKTFVSNLAGSSLNYLDRLLIPIFLGPTALTYYSLPGNVANHTPGVTNSLTAVLFPMVAGLKGVKENEKIKNIYIKSLRLITILSAAITVSIIAFAYKILFFWIGAELAEKSTAILIILALTYFVISLSRPLTSFLLGLEKTKFLAVCSVLMAIFNLILILALLPTFGITGAAWAFLISVLPIIIMFGYAEKHFFHLTNRAKEYFKLYFKIILTAVAAYLVDILILIPLSVNLFALIVLGPLAVIIYLLLYRLFGFYEREDWQTIKNFLGKVYQNLYQKSR